MKKLLTTFGLCIIFISVSCSQKTMFNQETLDSKLVTLDASLITFDEILNNHKNSVIVIEVWASWCSDCVKAIPKLKDLQEKNPDVTYVFISMDKDMQKWKDAITKHQLKGNHYWVNDPQMMKGNFGKSLDLDWIPRYLIIDKNQKIIIYRAIETDFEIMNTTLNKLK